MLSVKQFHFFVFIFQASQTDVPQTLSESLSSSDGSFICSLCKKELMTVMAETTRQDDPDALIRSEKLPYCLLRLFCLASFLVPLFLWLTAHLL